MIGKNDLEYFSRQAQGGFLNASEQQVVVHEVAQAQAEAERYRIASLGMFDPVRVGQIVAQLQIERDEARKLLRVALGLLSVASFQTDFEGRRCFDLERQIRTILE